MFRALTIAICMIFHSALLYAQLPSDPQATDAARHLYTKLQSISKQYTIFGHQDALAYGVGWKGVNGRADVKSVVNDYPGVYGWDIAHLELDSARDIDGVPFADTKRFIREGYERGGIITISWHARNPLSAGSAWDTTPGTVKAILPGGVKHELYISWLDKVAVFMNDLKDSKGALIPILFRPFHELTGNWFWWCQNVTTKDEFKELWKFTVHYLRDKKQLHHLLYVYNTAGFVTEAEFMEQYPGDDVTDLISFDNYQYKTDPQSREQFISHMRTMSETICRIASEKGKIAAIAETGLEAIPDPKWWTGVVWPIVKDLSIAYVLVWRNHGYSEHAKKMHYYAPYPKQVSAADFKRFYRNPRILFEKELKHKLQRP
ncbi:MAG: beta-mannosidase [Chitinophagaceae bacterium]|nr:beta-mannosidase [Chitinophagaceae bacterium]